MEKIFIIVYKEENETIDHLYDALQNVVIPEEYDVELLEVSNKSVAAAYNEIVLMDSKYKIYIDKSVSFLQENIILECLKLFEKESVAAVGVKGDNLILTDGTSTRVDFKDPERNMDIVSVDYGFFMTRQNILWKEGLFKKDLRYTIMSQCLEYRKGGFSLAALDNATEWIIKEEQKESKREIIDNFLREYSNTIFPLVSICIPTHERPDFFKEALDSAVSQTYSNIEIIISDNSEDDRTEKIIRKYQEKYSNIKYLRNPGVSAGINWNICWDNISKESEYVNFLMDDDLFNKDKIAVMVNYFLAFPQLSLVTSYRQLIDKNKNPLPDRECNKPVINNSGIIDRKNAGKLFFANCINWIGEPTTVLVKRELLGDRIWGGWYGKEKYLIDDYMLWLRLLEMGDMAYITYPLSYYRQHESNSSVNNYNMHITGCLAMASVIQYAWNNKIFIEDSIELKRALIAWLQMSMIIINACFLRDTKDFSKEDFNVLLETFREMSIRFTEENPEKIQIDLTNESSVN
ncbi:MAG: glycosyltransferase [Lachnospiraceae bacterium]|nr:glycosyltransferase [Lachnospiraceae bacterium]